MKYFYLFSSEHFFREKDIPRGRQLRESTPGAWIAWDANRNGFWVRVLRPAGPLESGPNYCYDFYGAFRLDYGDGYGVPVYEESRRLVGNAYSPYPHVPGTDAVQGRLMWPRYPIEEEEFRAPARMSSKNDVVRVGDGPLKFDFSAMNALKSRFVLPS
jgi:hypothetical protein